MFELPDTLKYRWPIKKGTEILHWPYSGQTFNEDVTQELPDDFDEAYERLVLWCMIESYWSQIYNKGKQKIFCNI